MLVYNVNLLLVKMKRRWQIITVAVLLSISVFYCQYFVYYVSLYSCDWPHADSLNETEKSNLTKIMFISDVHILGEMKGQPFDRIFHEWQMYRSFQTALHLFNPEFVFILGDILDEGEYASDEQYERYFKRFKGIFLGN